MLLLYLLQNENGLTKTKILAKELTFDSDCDSFVFLASAVLIGILERMLISSFEFRVCNCKEKRRTKLTNQQMVKRFVERRFELRRRGR